MANCSHPNVTKKTKFCPDCGTPIARRTYTVTIETTCAVDVEAYSEAEAMEAAIDGLGRGSGVQEQNLTAQFFENAQATSAEPK